MKSITSKFLCWLALSTILLSSFLLYHTHFLIDTHYRDVVGRQAAMALQFDLSIRKYAAAFIRPVMYDVLGDDEFIPETMSTSYIARSVFEDVRKQFPDYIIKFSSDNPRNPANQASPEELKIIKYLNENPQKDRWEGVIDIDGKQFMAKFSARRMKTSCLRCHGDPKDAPASLLKQYGDTAGFYRPIGQIVGLDTVAIPISKVTEGLWTESINIFLAIAGALMLFFLATAMAMRSVIISRVELIADHFQRTALLDDYTQIAPIRMKGRDEISLLANGYNALTDKLRRFYASLEHQVAVRTQALEEKNEQLEIEIANRRRTEKALRESEATIGSIFRAAPTGIGMLVNRVITQANPRLCQMSGYTADELLGQSSKMLYPTVEEFKRVGEEKYAQISAQGTGTVETQWVTKGGALRDIILSSTPLNTDDWSAGVTFTALDFTDLKRAETKEKLLEERLARSQKMEALGLLAGGVAHDLNNVLSGIVSFPDLLLMDLPEDSPMRKPIVTIQDSGQKAAAIVQDLLTMARRGVTQTEVLNLNDMVTDCLASLEWKKTLRGHAGIEIAVDLDAALLNIRGSAVHLRKACINLLINAAEALTHGGTINVVTRNQYVDRPIEGYDQVREGDYVVLTVTDNGTGIEERDIKRIFEPFYTKKVMGRSGTGLGMSVVWGTVQDHHGYIHVESTVDIGATFQLYFPVTRESLQPSQGAVPMADYLGDGQSILVVDDVDRQREIASVMLTRLGYRVSVASSGESAIDMLMENAVDLVVLDMIMDPGMDGLDTYQRILAHRPKQKAVIASGFSETGRVRKAQAIGAGAYIKKPYTLEKLGIAVRDELERQAR